MEGKLAIVFVLFCCFAISGNSFQPEKSSANHSIVEATRPFNYYALFLRWPQSFCRTLLVLCDNPPTQSYFTIRSLLPLYSSDEEVPPYETNNSCTNSTPTSPDSITLLSLRRIQADMASYWPYLYRNGREEDLRFWREEWRQHGMCSSYPTDPVKYFEIALDFVKAYNIRQILADVGNIIPANNRLYGAAEFSNAIFRKLQVFPLIYCLPDSTRQAQLYGIVICIGPSGHIEDLIDCPQRFTSCDANTAIRYPAAPGLTWESV